MCERKIFRLLCVISALITVRAELRFASYYGSHMVLQKAPEQAVLWGYGSDQYEVTIVLVGEQENHTQAVAVQNGKWRVTLPPQKAGGPYNVTALQNETQVTLTDVLFGDVWLCGGQSNMAFNISLVFNASQEMAQAPKYPDVRLFMAALDTSYAELIDLRKVRLPWSVPSEELVGHFSAVCWLFGRDLYKTLGYPVGLVQSCVGATPIEVWSSHRALQKCGLNIREAIDISYFYVPLYYTEEDTRAGKGIQDNSVLWNAMIHPFLNMTIKGVIWYQGEWNVFYHRDKYSCSFPAMIDDWRAAFHSGSGGQTAADFPFGFVQLCTKDKNSMTYGCPELRWHQTADFGFSPNPRMNNTFMAVSLDLPDETSPYGSLHPRDKQDVAYRLTLGARAVAYGEKSVSFQGPFPVTLLLSGDRINITYTQAVSVTSSKSIFEICCTQEIKTCDSSSTWLPAPIMQWGHSNVEVSISACKSMVSGLRYAWRDWPCDFKACPVYDANRQLPAPPFITNRLSQMEINNRPTVAMEISNTPTVEMEINHTVEMEINNAVYLSPTSYIQLCLSLNIVTFLLLIMGQ